VRQRWTLFVSQLFFGLAQSSLVSGFQHRGTSPPIVVVLADDPTAATALANGQAGMFRVPVNLIWGRADSICQLLDGQDLIVTNRTRGALWFERC